MTSLYPTICQLDTPLNNPSEIDLTEIEIVDPTHALYGRRFPLVSLSDSQRGPRHAMVAYEKDILLRVPFAATSLSSVPPLLSNAKISLNAVVDLLDLARQFNIYFQEKESR